MTGFLSFSMHTPRPQSFPWKDPAIPVVFARILAKPMDELDSTENVTS